MTKTFTLTIATPTEVLYAGNALSASFVGVAGAFEVLAHHEPLITTLKPGTIRYETAEGEERTCDVDGGIVEVARKTCTVLV